MSTLRIAFLHLAPCPSDLQYNRRLVDRAVTTAAYGATWILTPELCICGYDFTDDLGTAWIVPPPDPWMASLCRRAAHFGVTVFLSYPQQFPVTLFCGDNRPEPRKSFCAYQAFSACRHGLR
jgi:predicted amidohydrolase